MSAIDDVINALATAHDAVADAVSALAAAEDAVGRAVDAAGGLGSSDDQTALSALRGRVEELIGQGQTLADATEERQREAVEISN